MINIIVTVLQNMENVLQIIMIVQIAALIIWIATQDHRFVVVVIAKILHLAAVNMVLKVYLVVAKHLSLSFLLSFSLFFASV